jgi:hypothetical protein
MPKLPKAIFLLILFFSTYHLIRDIFQVFGLDNPFTDYFHWPHRWCRPYCDFITFPLDFLGIVGSTIVLRRAQLGKIGLLVLASFPVWLLALLLP